MEKHFTIKSKQKNFYNVEIINATIKDLYITDYDLDEYISEIATCDDVLEFVFNLNPKDINNKFIMIKRFIPNQKSTDLYEYIEEKMKNNKNFYSFFAELLHTIIMRDFFGYELCAAVVTVDSTLIDTHTGVDACMVDIQNGVFSFCESKFYVDPISAFEKINNDFTSGSGFFNKIENFYNKVIAFNKTPIILKRITDLNIYNLDINSFLEFKILFSGFVLHNDGKKYDESYYNRIKLNKKSIMKKISSVFNIEEDKIKIDVVLIHLPISEKKKLIHKIITHCIKEREKLINEQY